nr:MAG TPA: hypothetical protein [Caudoviricetes sp.]
MILLYFYGNLIKTLSRFKGRIKINIPYKNLYGSLSTCKYRDFYH